MSLKKIVLNKAREVAQQSSMSKKHGAVIVKNGKIISSACNVALLPSTKKELSIGTANSSNKESYNPLKGPSQHQCSL